MTRIRSSGSSNVRDRRGSGGGGLLGGGGGGGGFPIPMKAGGGILGVILLVVMVIGSQLMNGNSSSNDAATVDPGGQVDCTTEIEQVVCGAVDDVSLYWDEQFPVTFQGAFSGTDTVFFSGGTSTGCGEASAQTGPFYCPVDQLVYLDLDFLQQLQQQFGATGDLAAQYIVAHEYGHHVQNITGIADRVNAASQQNPDVAQDFGIALELQADCLAGAWASTIAERDLFDREGEIDEALNAAEAVGDDRIQAQAGQRVDPDSFTHGTAEQRRHWFEVGFSTGDPGQCLTFDNSLAP
ncbi:MAG: neutral zinc metallopeptidase [Ilumatobacteraceae bacterium]